jgi:sugar lactone lactonase YvrE
MMRSTTALLVLMISLIASPAVAADPPFPNVIQLPDGFRPEGIAVGAGTTFYTGSLGGLGVYKGDLRTGDGAIFIPGNDRTFVGMKVDDTGRLWIAGGGTGAGYAFDATTGEELASFQFASAPTFVNDVIVTREAAWFTESQRPVLYRVDIAPDGEIGAATTVDLTGKIEFVAGFNLNGIAATPDGSTLIVVNSSTGKLYAIDTGTIATHEIDLGGATMTQGDGILLHGQTLYVVRNRMNQIAVIELAPDLSSGTVVDVITNDDLDDPAAFDVPTTLTLFGDALYAVNARFTTTPTPTTPYTAVRVER